MLGQSFGVGGRHQLVLARPDDEDRPAEQTLLLGPLEQQPLGVRFEGIWSGHDDPYGCGARAGSSS